MTVNNKQITTAVAAGLFVLAGIIAFGLIMTLCGFGVLMPFAAMLYDVYGFSSFLIPAFLCVAGAFCKDATWSIQRIVCLAISVVPFFTISAAEQAARRIAVEDIGPIAITKILILMAIAILLAVMEYLVAMVLSTSSVDGNIRPRLKECKAFCLRKLQGAKLQASRLRTDLGIRMEELRRAAKDAVSEEGTAKKAPATDTGSEESDYVTVDMAEFDTKSSIEDKENSEVSAEDAEIEAAVEKSIDEAVSKLFSSKPEVDEEEPDNGDMLHTLERMGIIRPDGADGADLDMQNLDANELAVDEEEEEAIESFGGIPVEETSFDDAPADDEVQPSAPAFEEVGIISDTEEQNEKPRADEAASTAMQVFRNEEEESPETETVAMEDFREEEQEEAYDAVDAEEEESEYGGTVDMYELSLDEVFAKMDEDAEEEVQHAEERQQEYEESSAIYASQYGTQIEENLTTDKEEELDVVSDNDYLDEDELAVDSATIARIAEEETPQPEQIVKRAIQADGTPIPLPEPRRPRGPYTVSTELLTAYEDNPYWIIDEETNQAAENLKATLSEFGIKAEVTGIRKGPVVTMFEILPAPGVKLSKIVALQDNIALRLAASSVRIVAPIPGKKAVGIEIPNKNRAIVSFRECIEQDVPEWKKMAVPVILGKDIQGEMQIMDLVKTPHLLIAGSTGAGKSVCVNSMILSILYKRSPDQVKLILIDPKIVELKLYNDIPHLLTPVITEPKKAMQALQYCLCEMERRYALLDGMGVRDISSYNKRIVERRIATEKLPYLIIVIDEFADLMATTGKQLETVVARLAAMSRAVGIHLVLATQRPSIDVITGLIKANIPSRVAFMVASKTDSRIIIDQMGAEKLLGKGDMLYASSTDPFPVRIQGAFVSDQEVENVVEAVKSWGEPEYIDDEIFVPDDDEDEDDQMSLMGDNGDDPLYDKALDIVVQAGKASASYIQRRLKIGYNRAARLVELMEERGIVGPANGSKPRELIHVP